MSLPETTAWIPKQQTFDGVEMVFVPAGCFMMGSSASDIKKLSDQHPDLSTFFSNQGPQTKICFDSPFWIDKYLVTNEQFRRLNGEADRKSHWAGDKRPRESVTWFEARDFCVLREGRLPTEAEWEYAARGQDSLVYPWGNEWNPANAVWSPYYGDEYPEDRNRQTADVGSKPDGISWVGALDMAGNVWEWTNSLYEPYPYDKDDGREDMGSRELRTLRGGSWAYSDFYFQSAYQSSNNFLPLHIIKLVFAAFVRLLLIYLNKSNSGLIESGNLNFGF